MDPDVNEYINIEDALKRIRGNKVLYVKMLKMYLASEDFVKLESALAQGDLQQAANVAHAIKGVTSNLSLTKLYESSASLMAKLRRNEKDDEIFDSFREISAKTRECVNTVINTILD